MFIVCSICGIFFNIIIVIVVFIEIIFYDIVILGYKFNMCYDNGYMFFYRSLIKCYLFFECIN